MRIASLLPTFFLLACGGVDPKPQEVEPPDWCKDTVAEDWVEICGEGTEAKAGGSDEGSLLNAARLDGRARLAAYFVGVNVDVRCEEVLAEGAAPSPFVPDCQNALKVQGELRSIRELQSRAMPEAGRAWMLIALTRSEGAPQVSRLLRTSPVVRRRAERDRALAAHSAALHRAWEEVSKLAVSGKVNDREALEALSKRCTEAASQANALLAKLPPATPDGPELNQPEPEREQVYDPDEVYGAPEEGRDEDEGSDSVYGEPGQDDEEADERPRRREREKDKGKRGKRAKPSVDYVIPNPFEQGPSGYRDEEEDEEKKEPDPDKARLPFIPDPSDPEQPRRRSRTVTPPPPTPAP